jgi:hypothetical protein
MTAMSAEARLISMARSHLRTLPLTPLVQLDDEG